jgi:hypothetical protein
VRADKNKQINNPKLQDPTMLPTRNSIYLLIFAVLGIEFRASSMIGTLPVSYTLSPEYNTQKNINTKRMQRGIPCYN